MKCRKRDGDARVESASCAFKRQATGKESEGRLAERPSLRLDQPSVQVGLFESPSELPSVPKLPVHVNSVWFPCVIVKR